VLTERNSLLAAAGEHVGLAREAHEGLAVGHVDGDLDLLFKILVDVGGEARAQVDLVALAVRETFDAELLAFGDDALRIVAVDRDELGEIHLPARQALGELQAQARGGRLRFGLVVDHAEAVLGAQLLVGQAHLRIVGERQARLQGVDGGPPVGATLERVGEHDEGLRLQGGLLRALIGEVGRARGIDGKVVALAALVGVGRDCEQRARKPEPGSRVLIIGYDGAGETARGRARILGNRALALGAQRRPVAAAEPPVRLEIGLVALGVGLDVVMGEGSLLGLRAGGGE
jgi:hypothetical protein